MKFKLFYWLLAFIALPLGVFSQNINEDILGCWVVDYDKSIMAMSNKAKDFMERLPQEGRNNIKTMNEGRRLLLNSDGSFLIKLANGQKSSGTWELEGQEYLKLISLKGREKLFLIKELKTNVLVIENQGETRGVSKLISIWSFIKCENNEQK